MSEHSDPRCRALHYIGSISVLIIIGFSLLFQNATWLLLTPIAGYGFAWLGHGIFEHNRPATFEHPLYSFMADWLMLAQWLSSIFKSS
nr:DUF962 domain-containing protein [Shewanella sp. Isolate11]